MPELKEILSDRFSFEASGNPDFWVFSSETFGIDESRDLKERSAEKSFGNKKIIVITFNTITHEAQGALLKLFEEPVANTHFFILTRSAESFLPTLRSRLAITKVAREELRNTAQDFLKLDFPDRQKEMTLVVDSYKDEKINKEEIFDFLNGLEEALYKEMVNSSKDEELVKSLGTLLIMRKDLESRSPSVKMILENLALSLPRIKTISK